ncbi:MazG family protein [Epidermidibacterium keratini]|uniref:MazG family protein n=1 Tax=Epidermidibacterium keratini TaxID=1891644 RepID=A0A7L4YRV4_9ACTN|nr:MazG family protein [Epidermidibacterium keratini]QHC01287.1 MazG family protein [Epidermidibacterium keratini]
MSEPDSERGLLRAVRVMDRLRSPGGCPWDAEQDHRSLAPYLLEEAYEAVDAIDGADRAHLREELGDVLLQVLFHARIAADDETAPFDIDDVADGLADKLERRHPHVFGDTVVDGAAQVDVNWEQIKAAEKGRTGPYDGVTWSQPSLSLAAQVLRRAERAGQSVELAGDDAEAELAASLLQTVQRAREVGVDPELALRRALREFAAERR